MAKKNEEKKAGAKEKNAAVAKDDAAIVRPQPATATRTVPMSGAHPEAGQETKIEPPAPPAPEPKPKSQAQVAAEASAREGQKYYDRYPKIRGGICEFCGIHYSKCPHYADFHAKYGDFICTCGRSKDPMAAKQLNLMYIPHRGYFVCDSSGCQEIYKDRFGGYERLVSYHFFVSEVPYDGTLLPDPSDPHNRATTLSS